MATKIIWNRKERKDRGKNDMIETEGRKQGRTERKRKIFAYWSWVLRCIAVLTEAPTWSCYVRIQWEREAVSVVLSFFQFRMVGRKDGKLSDIGNLKEERSPLTKREKKCLSRDPYPSKFTQTEKLRYIKLYVVYFKRKASQELSGKRGCRQVCILASTSTLDL